MGVGSLKGRGAVFLDRDGVINRNVYYPSSGEWESPRAPEDFEFLPGAIEALARLRAHQVPIFLVSNQSSHAKGKASLDSLQRVHARLVCELDARGIRFVEAYYCWHHPAGTVAPFARPCECRKPSPFFLLEARDTHNVNLADSWMIGDRMTDIECGRRAGTRTILIRGSESAAVAAGDLTDAPSLLAAVDIITTRSAYQAQTPAADPARRRVKLFLDGAYLDQMKSAYASKSVEGFTTNPTLMRKAGISDYKAFALDVIGAIPDMPVSFEVFSDDLQAMAREARTIASWGGFTYVKIPITNTHGELTTPIIRTLSAEGLRLNVTAVFTIEQVKAVASALSADTPAVVSIFAGRIADTGVDPVPLVREAVGILRNHPLAEVLWASPREFLNVFHAESAGCHIITATADLLAKLTLVGKDLGDYSLETVCMFFNDARASGFSIL